MDEQQKYPKFVVTVLSDNKPILVCEVVQESEHAESLELFYPDVDSLQVAKGALESAASGSAFSLWKETGVLPAPADMTPCEDPEDYPF